MTLLRDVIGLVLRRARRDQGKTLRDVAEASRVSLQYLSEVERGRKEASSEVLAAICAALGWELVDLLDATRAELTAVPVDTVALRGTTQSVPASRARLVTLPQGTARALPMGTSRALPRAGQVRLAA